jgi:hypothetical protein
MSGWHQILRLDPYSGKWVFVAHGAGYSKGEADAWVKSAKARGETARLLKCRKPKPRP